MFLKLRYLLKMNYILFLDNELLRDGNYQNVTSGLPFYSGEDMSKFVVDDNPKTLAPLGLMNTSTGAPITGRVYQSAFKNWVYESGVVPSNYAIAQGFTAPIRVSGVYVDGRFCPTDSTAVGYDASCAHTVDYLNGRVIFDQDMPANLNVHADFAFKEVAVVTASKFNNQLVGGVLETKFTTNPRTAGQLIYPSGGSRILPYPVIFVEDASRDYEAYQLGDRSLIAIDEMAFHIYALDESTRDNLVDLVSFQERKRIPIIDFNSAPFPLSGITNTLSPDYIPYQELVKENVVVSTREIQVSACSPSGNPITTPIIVSQRAVGFLGDIENTRVLELDQFRQEPQAEVFERAVVRNETRVYTIAPISPFGFELSPIFPSGS